MSGGLKAKAIEEQKNALADAKKSKISGALDKETIKLDKIHEDIDENGEIITKENIHLYYEFMDNNYVKSNNVLIANALEDRLESIYTRLGFANEADCSIMPCEFGNYLEGQYAVMGSDKIPYQIVFSIKDTLKPIDEYIEEIKQSEEYIKYISEKNLHGKISKIQTDAKKELIESIIGQDLDSYNINRKTPLVSENQYDQYLYDAYTDKDSPEYVKSEIDDFLAYIPDDEPTAQQTQQNYLDNQGANTPTTEEALKIIDEHNKKENQKQSQKSGLSL